MLNIVYYLLKKGKKDEAIKYFNKEIISYVDTHLKAEEEFMEKINYPELKDHKKIHETFRKMITDLIPSVESGDHKAFSHALAISWGWLYNHIAKTDKKYGIFAKENGYI